MLADDVSTWLDANWDPSITVGEWWKRLASAGYAYPEWPRGMGGFDARPAERRLVTTALADRGVIGPPTGHVGATLTVPTLLVHGNERQQQRFIPAVAEGTESWCQLFSEPGSGSDLASLATRAEPDGDGWVITGQKVWNSAADSADLGMLLARTDSNIPKHAGITFFLIDMHQPGVDVRPLKQMNGLSTFCEVFLSDVRAGPDRVLGQVGDGWRIAQTTLAAERRAVADSRSPRNPSARSGSNGDLSRPVAEVIAEFQAAASGELTSLRGSALPWKVMLDLAQGRGSAHQPVMRQELARYFAALRVNRWLVQRVGESKGRLTGADGSLTKLATSRICQRSRDLGYQIVGMEGVLAGDDSLLEGAFQTIALGSPGARLGGGTDEIQLNVIGERALGLPREPSVDKDVPYRDLTVGTQNL